MLALAKSPAQELTEGVTSIAKGEDARLNGATLPTLRLELKDKTTVTLAIDPDTHLIRQSRTVGPWALVGLGAVVLEDVPAAEVWVGVPARRLRKVELPADLVVAP